MSARPKPLETVKPAIAAAAAAVVVVLSATLPTKTIVSGSRIPGPHSPAATNLVFPVVESLHHTALGQQHLVFLPFNITDLPTPPPTHPARFMFLCKSTRVFSLPNPLTIIIYIYIKNIY